MGVFGDWANKYWEAGLSVIPVDGKRAFTKDWTKWCSAIAPEAMIEDWISKYPNHNIGLCLGPVSKLVAFDIDTDDENIIQVINSIIPPSPCAKRGAKGLTLFYKLTNEIKTSIKVNGHNLIDILADGSQTVIPPSFHPTAHVSYAWIGKSILDLDDDLPTLGIELINKLTRALNGLDIESADRPEGRNNSLKSYVSAIMDNGTFDDVVEKAIKYDELCFGKKSLFKDKSEFKSDSVYANAFEFCSNIKKSIMRQRLDRGEVVDKKDKSDERFEMMLSLGFYSTIETKNGAREVPEYRELALYFKDRLHLKVINNQNYLYLDEHYKSVETIRLEAMIEQLTKGNIKSLNALSSFLKFARISCVTDEPQPLNGFLNLKNGVLDFKANKLLPHSPERFFRYKINHAYDPGAKCPEWLEFLNRIFEGDQELIQLSKEVFGYILSGSAPWLHKAFFLYGEGRNGKSTWLDVLREILGPSNISTIPLSHLDKPFSVVTADGKLANIVGETSADDLSSEAFKTAVGGEALIAAQKGMPEYSMPFTAKMIFAANKKPHFKDATSGNYEKLVFIPFNYYLKPEERIAGYAQNFLFKEISGIINWAVEGYFDLQKRGSLLEPRRVKEELEEYRIESDSVQAWVIDKVKVGEDCTESSITLRDYYQTYRNWCEKEYRLPVSKIEFSRRLAFILRKMIGLEWTRPHNLTCVKGKINFPEKEISRDHSIGYTKQRLW